MFTTLPMLIGEIVAEWGWTVTDSFLVIKVLIGVLAAAVGAVAVTAAARDDQAPPGAGRDSAPIGSDQGQMTESKRIAARPPLRGLDESVPAPRSPPLPCRRGRPTEPGCYRPRR
jgi:hypothetical protein